MNENHGQFVFDLGKLNASAASGTLPERIMLMPYGSFSTVKGKIVFDKARAERAVANFNNGVGRVYGTSPLPVNFNHKQSDKAGGWIHELFAEDDGLYGRTTWSKSGKEALEGEEYRFCSVEYWFQNFVNPHDTDKKFSDVVEGAALTNIPLMSNMKPVMADRSTTGLTTDEMPNIVYLEHRSTNVPVTLDEARAMKPADLNDEARSVLTASKEKLSFAEREAFGLDKAPEKTPEQIAADRKTADDEAAARLEASKVGMVSKVDFDRQTNEIENLKAEGRKRDAKEIVEKHVARGAIKQDAAEKWADKIAASADDADRKELTEMLEGLPSNELLANNHNGSAEGGTTSDLQEELKTETLKIQASAKEKGRDITYGQAQEELLRTNKDLDSRLTAERNAR